MIQEFSVDDAPKRDRKGVSKFESTPEWKALEAKLRKGLKPKAGVMVVLTPEQMEEYGIQNRRSIARFIQKYLELAGLDYQVKAMSKDGHDVITVAHTVQA